MSTATRILIVDDEPEIRALLRKCFEREGFEVAEASSGLEMWAEIERQPISLITLDLTLGREDGLDLARQVRAKHDIALIMITGKGDTIDRVVGLELGADDYITKPFQLREVLARVRAVLRRSGSAEAVTGSTVDQRHERYAFAGLVLDVTGRTLKEDPDGAERELTTAEFSLLEVLVKRPHRVLSRDNLMDLLKGNEWSPLDRSIDVLVGRLRRKIEPDFGEPSLIKTVRGVGYVLSCDVKSV
jgi:DNA-binding response OmpR family regulator